MSILITGSEGYIGSVLGPTLRQCGHRTTGIDAGFFADHRLGRDEDGTTFIKKDTRDLTKSDLDQHEAIIHLADLSNDPLGQLDPGLTQRINHQATIRLATMAREVGIQRFIFSSSCSVYGKGTGEFKHEDSPTSPLTEYARCKLAVEDHLLAMAGRDFEPVILRNATAYGASPRLRMDLVVNNLTGHAHVNRMIRMTSDGTPWRPLVHVKDIATAMRLAVEAEADELEQRLFNVGATEENYQVREVAEIVARKIPGCELSFGKPDGDDRSYRVDCSRIKSALGFEPSMDVPKGVTELIDLYSEIPLDADTFGSRHFTRLKQIQYLLNQEMLNHDLRWTSTSTQDMEAIA